MDNRSNPVETVVKAVEHAPRWPAAVALIVIGLIYLLLPEELIIGPRWLLLLLSLLTPVLFAMTVRQGFHHVARLLSLGVLTLATIIIATSAAFLVAQLQTTQPAASTLLRDAALIWCVNVVVFALWYWEIDSGGPAKRRIGHHRSNDFVFPQMTLDDEASKQWSPAFIDYLFLAFNTSTAFSPTDTLVLSRHAKLLMMAQSLVSLVVIAVLAARAVNTL